MIGRACGVVSAPLCTLTVSCRYDITQASVCQLLTVNTACSALDAPCLSGNKTGLCPCQHNPPLVNSSVSRSARSAFVDEGIDTVLDTLQQRVGVNVLMIGTVSWLGLKAGRSISHKLDGWPDHGVPEPIEMKGGAYFTPHPEYYAHTAIKDFRAKDEVTAGFDVLEAVIPAAKSAWHARHARIDGAALQICGARLGQQCRYRQHAAVPGDRPLRTHRVGTVHQQPGLPPLVAEHDRGPVPQLRHRRHHVVQRAAQPARPDDRRAGAGLLLRALPPRGHGARHRRRAGAQGLPRRVGLFPAGARGRQPLSTAR